MAWRNSLHGRKVQYDDTYIYLNGRAVGRDFATKGQDWFVDSAVDAGSGENPDEAVGTLDEAFALCTANVGERILVMPNHAETITGAAGIAHDKAGVSVIGLGHGNQRPRFLMDAGTSVTYKITAADALVRNLEFVGGHNGIVTCIDVQTTGKYAWIDNCLFGDNTTDEHFLTCIKSGTTTDNQCDGLKVTNNEWRSIDAGSLEFIETLGDIDYMEIIGNTVMTEGTASPLLLCTAGDDMQYVKIVGNFLTHKMTANELLVNNNQSDNTGIIAHNRVGHADVTTSHDLGIDGLGCRLWDNLSMSTDSVSGFVLPAIDADS